MIRRVWFYLDVVILLLILGCSAKVIVPPEVDLKRYGTVGVFSFTSNAGGDLSELVTQEFLKEIRKSQKSIRIIELVSSNSVLQPVKNEDLSREAIQNIGQKYCVNAVITGNLDISDIRPEVDLGRYRVAKSIDVKAEVEASLTVKLAETESGFIVWTDSARDEKKVAALTIYPDGRRTRSGVIGSHGALFFDSKNRKKAYQALARSLVEQVTKDFKATYR